MEEQKIKKPKDPKYKNSPEYNKKYYASHKTEILLSLKTKCECPDCGRIVSYSRLNLHRKTDICFRNKKNDRERNRVPAVLIDAGTKSLSSTDLTKMKEQVERLTKLLEEKENN